MTETPKILIVEDNKAHLQNAVEQLGHFVDLTTAKNFDSGLDALRDGKFTFMLTDLMMPKGTSRTMGDRGMEMIFEEMPYGFPLAFYAARKEVPIIAIVTDINHHQHPMAYSFDYIHGVHRINNSILKVGGAPMMPKGDIYVKDWARALLDLREMDLKEAFPEMEFFQKLKEEYGK